MGKLQVVSDILRTVITNPRSILQVLQEDSIKEKDKVQKKYGLTNGLPTIDLLDLFPNFRITVEPYSFLEGTSSVIDIALLNALAESYQDCKYLEIGTWKGESVSNVARFADRCVSISLSNEEMLEAGLSQEFVKVHRYFSSNLNNVQHIVHNSHTFDYSSLKCSFDLIFIDGDHSYQGVMIDTINVFELLRDKNSVIVWHDYGSSPERIRWDVLAGILDGCPPEKRKYLYHVSNTLCAIFIQSDFRTTFTRFPQTPNKKFEITISARSI